MEEILQVIQERNLLRKTIDKSLIYASGKDRLSVVNNKGLIYKQATTRVNRWDKRNGVGNTKRDNNLNNARRKIRTGSIVVVYSENQHHSRLYPPCSIYNDIGNASIKWQDLCLSPLGPGKPF